MTTAAHLQWRGRLLSRLIYRELAGRYRGTIFGWVWPLLVQLSQLLVFTYLFAAIFHVRLRLPTADAPLAYGIWLFVALLTWNALQIGVQGAAVSIIGQPNLVKRVVFPLALLPLVPVGAAFVEGAAGMVVAISIMPFLGFHVPWTALFVPLIWSIVLMFACGLAYITASLTLFLRDVPQVLGPIFLFTFYLTPVVYPVESVPGRFQYIAALNPMAVAVATVRAVVLHEPLPDTWRLVYSVLIAVAVFVLGLRLFRQLRPGFGDVL